MDPAQPITPPSKAEVDRRMVEWAQAMELSNALLMAGLRQKNHDRKWREIEEVQERRRQALKQIHRSGDDT
jgi:hypothetical protein